MALTPEQRKALTERITTKFVIADSGCWEWVAAKYQTGYGALYRNGGTRFAHRIIYEILVGEIPLELQLDHLCRNRLCVNPAHLEPVTCAENLRRGIGQLPHTHCRRGHPMTADNLIWDTPKIRRCRACSQARNAAAYRRKNAHA